MKKVKFYVGHAFIYSLLFLSCSKSDHLSSSPESTENSGASAERFNSRQGVVFTMTNDAGQNRILSFMQNSNGTLEPLGVTVSGGAGTGTDLGALGALAYNVPQTWLFAVNAGSNTISSFHIRSDGSLSLLSTVPSGGIRPVSLTVNNDLLFTVNAGSANISGFTINYDGTLTPIAGSSQPLSDPSAIPGQISFKPDGKILLVTEKNTSKISSYQVNAQGITKTPIVFESAGLTPMGLGYAGSNFTGMHYILVSQAMQGLANGSTLSAYSVSPTGTVASLQLPMASNQTAATAIASTKDGQYSFVSNRGSNSISLIRANSGGSMQLVNPAAAVTDAGPADISFSGDESYVYTLNKTSNTITGYKRTHNERLSKVTTISIPAHSSGLVGINKLFY